MLSKNVSEGPLSDHLASTCHNWKTLQSLVGGEKIEVNGEGLEVAAVVAVAQYGCIPKLTEDAIIVRRMDQSVEVLMDQLRRKYHVYGVNTGFGGSADSRTDRTVALQAALLQLTQAGILVGEDRSSQGTEKISRPVVEAIFSLLKHGLTPVIPLRGTVSASGDLMPLAYIAEGLGINPMTLGPGERLGLVNGTASSAALGALAMHQAHTLAILTQCITVGVVEALQGNAESFYPFIAAVRPHPGQIESARNMRALIQGSGLAQGVGAQKKDRNRPGMVQDRYALRSAPQWISPQLEDLLAADNQVATELNSSCDNPLVDVDTNDIYYGCNFQAAAITSAMEKARLSIQMLGKLIFSQLTEMVDPTLNNGLPTNLVADDACLFFAMKGVDISMAAYMSELAYLASPISSHVQAAEMHNQSVNSMAVVSVRLTMQAIDLMSLMTACSIYAICQALDLRVMHLTFLSLYFGTLLSEDDLTQLDNSLRASVTAEWAKTNAANNVLERCERTIANSLITVIKGIAVSNQWRTSSITAMLATYEDVSASFFGKQHTVEMLGYGSKILYRTVREELGVPFHKGLVEHPTAKIGSHENGQIKRTVGSWISIIYEAIRDGTLVKPLMGVLPELVAHISE
ncbi:aromatic amino acid ammonia-lyase [Aspergillus undulatus]|uniref:aromatic amino acid ammonia-lyase n=1 Tax=Aspergillus undulatus TaxID=1810928 RepID=UPI003CCE0845